MRKSCEKGKAHPEIVPIPRNALFRSLYRGSPGKYPRRLSSCGNGHQGGALTSENGEIDGIGGDSVDGGGAADGTVGGGSAEYGTDAGSGPDHQERDAGPFDGPRL